MPRQFPVEVKKRRSPPLPPKPAEVELGPFDQLEAVIRELIVKQPKVRVGPNARWEACDTGRTRDTTARQHGG
jgi:hypothetical protein